MPTAPRDARLSDLGEWGLIARLPQLLPPEPAWVILGRGADDAAALDLGGPDLVLLTCDAQLEGRHFRRAWIGAHDLGRRAAAVNLSDIAAMGGTPRAALVSLQLPRDLEVGFYDDLMRGLGEHFQEHGAAVVGGNLAESASRISIDVMVLGSAPRDRVGRRAGARPGDRILVTGWPGESAAGLALLRRDAPRPRARTELVRRHIDPTPRVAEGRALVAGGASAMLDVSDGLAGDLLHLCEASGVGAELDLSRVPVSAALRLAARQLEQPTHRWILYGGEDYELLCTAPPDRVPGLRAAVARPAGLPLTEIGVVLPASEGLWLLQDGQRKRLSRRGYEHFGARAAGRASKPRQPES